MDLSKYRRGSLNTEEAQQMVYDASKPGITPKEVHLIYEAWADNYNSDMIGFVYNGPAIGVAELTSLLKDRYDAKILDAAAGTGQCGALLHKKGYTNLEALEPNEKMVKEAKKLNVYKNFYMEFLGPNRLPIADDSFDAILTTGSFIPGHVKEDCYEELARIAKPGGYIVIVMNERYLNETPDYSANLEPRMLALQNHGVWQRIERKLVPNFQGQYNGLIFVLQTMPQKTEKLQTLSK